MAALLRHGSRKLRAGTDPIRDSIWEMMGGKAHDSLSRMRQAVLPGICQLFRRGYNRYCKAAPYCWLKIGDNSLDPDVVATESRRFTDAAQGERRSCCMDLAYGEGLLGYLENRIGVKPLTREQICEALQADDCQHILKTGRRLLTTSVAPIDCRHARNRRSRCQFCDDV